MLRIEYNMDQHHTTLYNYKKMPKTNSTCSISMKPRLAKSRNSMMAMTLIKQLQETLLHILDLFFAGRCSAVKLKEHMIEFLTKHQLEISNLVSICTNGPNVNQKSHRETEDALLQVIIMGYFQFDPAPYTLLTMDLLSTLSAFINLN